MRGSVLCECARAYVKWFTTMVSNNAIRLPVIQTNLPTLFCLRRLDGKIAVKKRQAMVNDFNNPNNPNAFAFLLSSKVGSPCGLGTWTPVEGGVRSNPVTTNTLLA